MKKQIFALCLLPISVLSAMEDKLEKYKKELQSKNQYEKNLLIVQAAGKGKIPKLQVLLELGADICKDSQKRYNNTPLHEACKHGHEDCIRFLLENGAYHSSMLRDKSTPLHVASVLGNLTCVNILLNAGAAYDARDSVLYTPLHRALEKNHKACVRRLLSAESH